MPWRFRGGGCTFDRLRSSGLVGGEGCSANGCIAHSVSRCLAREAAASASKLLAQLRSARARWESARGKEANQSIWWHKVSSHETLDLWLARLAMCEFSLIFHFDDSSAAPTRELSVWTLLVFWIYLPDADFIQSELSFFPVRWEILFYWKK